MWTVKQVSRITGVSVRTLHHYDAIGLLRPAKVTDAGYRLYDDAALRRLQNILLFRELQFPLKEIKAILDSPNFDPAAALEQQIQLLEMQRRHIGDLIAFARALQQKGASIMDFKPFDTREMEQYKAEAKARWGGSEAWRESARKEAAGADFAKSGRELMELLAGFGALRQLPPDAPAVQEKAAALQAFITEHYYTCTKEILSGLGQMYTEDERFRQNIDCAGGEGTAAFVRRAIEAHCAKE